MDVGDQFPLGNLLQITRHGNIFINNEHSVGTWKILLDEISKRKTSLSFFREIFTKYATIYFAIYSFVHISNSIHNYLLQLFLLWIWKVCVLEIFRCILRIYLNIFQNFRIFVKSILLYCISNKRYLIVIIY